MRARRVRAYPPGRIQTDRSGPPVTVANAPYRGAPRGLLEFVKENPIEAGLLATSASMLEPAATVADGLLTIKETKDAYDKGGLWPAIKTGALGTALTALPLVPAALMLAGKGAKTADLVQLRKAEDLEKAGGNADDIWRETGWGRGTDGEWRFEIDDSGAVLSDGALGATLNAGKYSGRDLQTNYSGAVAHPELSRAYDMYEDVDIGHYPQNTGAYIADDNAIRVKATDPKEGRSTLLHETQHAVQNREGFARGGSPGQFGPLQTTYTADELTDAAIIDKMMSGRGGMNQLDAMEHFKKVIGREPARKAFSALERVGRGKTLDGARDAARLAEDPMESYRRLAGEVEARNVQTRRDWTPEQRRETPPWATEDVPRDQQIVRRGLLGDGPQMSADLPMDEASRMARADEHFPVEAFHGTNKDFSEFGARGSATKAKSAKKAYWFVEDPKSAGGYADNAADSDVQKLIDASQAAERRGEWDNANSLMVQAEKLEQSTPHRGQSVIPARLGGNLKEVDMDGVQYDPDDVNLSEILDGAKSEGFDGVKLMNFSDEAGYGQYNPTTHYAVFDPKNIRSRFAKFDPKNRNSSDLLAGVAGAGLLGVGARAAIPPEDERGLLY